MHGLTGNIQSDLCQSTKYNVRKQSNMYFTNVIEKKASPSDSGWLKLFWSESFEHLCEYYFIWTIVIGLNVFNTDFEQWFEINANNPK